jgi:hypothetical protein
MRGQLGQHRPARLWRRDASAVFTSDGRQILGKDREAQTWLWDVRWLAGTSDWARSESFSLAEAVCREKLRGAPVVMAAATGEGEANLDERLLSEDDVRAAPLLRGREGEDVCETFLRPQKRN